MSKKKLPSSEELTQQVLALEVERSKQEIRRAELELAKLEQETRLELIKLQNEAKDQEIATAINEILLLDASLDMEERELKLAKEREANQERVLYLNDEVDDDMAAYLRGALFRWQWHDDAQAQPHPPVTVLINSPGGYVTSGLEIVDTIQKFRNKGWTINTQVTGIAMSMAAVILQAGERREMTPHASFMIHEISSVYFGSTSEMKNQLMYTETLQKHCSGLLAERSNQTFDQIEAMWERKDVYLTATEALERGFIDGIAQ